ncbi:MAG: SpoIIE family protein phosphatase [Lachnospiraceae bacterium]|nr:SpoIIE family protein phosphatase [Lachnospiraceae bacterium]
MTKRIGIKGKVALITSISMCVLTAMIGWVGYRQYYRNVLDSYVKYATMVTESANEVFENYSVGDMVDAREMPPAYEEARLHLNAIKNNADIKYLYAVYFEDIDDPDSICYVINAKSDEELSTGEPLEEIYSYMGEACEEDAFARDTLELFRICLQTKDSEVRYKEEETTEYGHIVTCYRAVFDSAGEAVAVIGADIDVIKINQDMATYLRTILLIAVFMTLIVIFLVLFFIRHFITDPVAKISESADSFVALMNRDVTPEELIYDKVQVSSKDEVRVLSDDVASMAEGIRRYMINLQTVTADKERIGAELNLASQIQADMLPHIFPAFPERDEFDIYASMTPAKEVGGDFYDFFLVDDSHLGLVMADVSGKGVPAALFMMVSKILVQNAAMSGKGPAEALRLVNEQICANNREEMFVTVWLGILDLATGVITAANAGHEYPTLMAKDGQFELIKDKHGFVVGGMEGLKYKEYELQMEPGAKLFIYTDGVPEATSAEKELFGTDRMLKALNEVTDATPEDVLKHVHAAVDGFVRDAEQFDDLTMLCLEFRGGYTPSA